MTEYHKCQISLSKPQLSKLCKGGGVRVSNKDLSGPHTVHLTKRQCNKIAKCKRLKTGLVLKMSEKQVRHNVRHGGSLADIIRQLAPYAKTALKTIAPYAIDQISGVAKRKYGKAAPIIEGLSELVKKRISGLGRKPRVKKGKGWLSWLTNPVGDALKDVVKPIGEIARENPELTQIAMNAAVKGAMGGMGAKKRTGTKTGGFFGIKDIMGMGAKKRTTRRKKAGSFLPPGY